MLMNIKRKLGVYLLAQKDTDKIIEDVNASSNDSLVYKVGSQFLIDKKFPLHIYLELSRACNYRCPMCMREASSAGGHFPMDLAQRITAEAAAVGPTSYSLHLFGEPLANPRWFEIVRLIREAHPHNGILLTTNGYFLGAKNCNKLIELGVDKVFVSLHSLDPDTYKDCTGGADLGLVLDNIRTFSKIAGKKSKPKLFVRLFKKMGDEPVSQEHIDPFRALGISVEVRGYHNFAGGKSAWTTLDGGIERWPCPGFYRHTRLS